MMEKLTEELILKQEDVEAQAIGDHLLTNAVLNIKTHCRNSTTVSRTKANMTAVFSVYTEPRQPPGSRRADVR